MTYPAVDIALARRLERAEGLAGIAYVEARRALHRHAVSAWTEIAGAHVMFDGASSPITQTFGVGVHQAWGAPEFERAEAFFADRGAPTLHEVCSFAAPEVWSHLSARGYSPVETSTVLMRPTRTRASAPTPDIVTRLVADDETALWSRVAVEGWRTESEQLAAAMEDLGPVVTRTRGTHCFLAELLGEPVAAGVVNLHNGVALFGGACTVPSARRRGAQGALLRARLEFAASHGVALAMVVTPPGGTSQRNAERQGFRPAYSRTKWRREDISAPAQE